MTQSSTSSTSAPRRDHPLYIFTTSQTPLAARYPRPTKPTLNVPPLIHRSLHQSLDQSPPSLLINENGGGGGGGITIPHPDQLRKHDIPVAPEHDEVEVTLKIHLVGDGSAEERSGWVQDALGLLDTHLGLGGADTLLVGFKGVDYKGKKTDTSQENGNGEDVREKVPTSEYSVSPEVEEQILEFWSLLTANLRKDDTKVKNLGTMYLPLGILKRLKQADGGLVINSLDTPDCHHLPKDYTGWARENEVQLWAGGGGEGSGQFRSYLISSQILASHISPPILPCSRRGVVVVVVGWDARITWAQGQPTR